MNYTTNELMERLGTVATIEDAEAAMERAEDWYNRTPKASVLAWYEAAREGREGLLPEIVYDDGTLHDDWAVVAMFYRAASLADLKD